MKILIFSDKIYISNNLIRETWAETGFLAIGFQETYLIQIRIKIFKLLVDILVEGLRPKPCRFSRDPSKKNTTRIQPF